MKYHLSDQSGKKVADVSIEKSQLSTDSKDQDVLARVKYLNELKNHGQWQASSIEAFLAYQVTTSSNAYSKIQLRGSD
jgi:hypothetical protein